MKIKNLVLATSVLGIFAAAPAHAVIVGGIDFGPTVIGQHFETATLAQQFINGDGQTALAYGLISTVNGSGAFCASGNCSLYYVARFENSTNFSATNVEFTSASLSVYFSDAAAINLQLGGNSSAQNLNFIQSLDQWVKFINNGSVTGTGTLMGSSILTGEGKGLFDVDLAWGNPDVANFLNGNDIPDSNGGYADIDMTSSFTNHRSRWNPRDNVTGCDTGQAVPGQWCYGGTANISGATVLEVPEPASLALLGLGLLGLGVARRRSAQK